MAIAAIALTPAAAGAADITVTSNLDNNGAGCTLREAIASANSGSASGCVSGGGADRIIFDVAQFPPGDPVETINFASSEPLISSDVTIQGYGSDQLTVDGAAGQRVFAVHPTGTATIVGIKVTGGSLAGSGFVRGGGIHNQGTLTIDDVCVCGNTVTGTESGAGNTIAADGAGISTLGPGALTVLNSVIDGNVATATQSSATGGGFALSRGGGIYQGDTPGVGTVTITNSTISNNAANAIKTNSAATIEVDGGGVHVVSSLNVSRSTFSGNRVDAASTGGAFSRGGALFVGGNGSSSLHLSTIADNRTEASAVPLATEAGGGVAVSATANPLSVTSSTIARNGSTSTPAPVDESNVSANFSTITFKNSIVSDPFGGLANCTAGADIASAGFNDDHTVPSSGSCGFGMGTDTTADPLLDPAGLAANGGATETIALQTGSPMIDKGSNAGQSQPGIDQRGLTRPSEFFSIPNADNGTDIGAFEVQSTESPPFTQPPAVPVVQPPAVGPTGQRAAALKKCKKKKAKKARTKCKKKAKALPI